MPLSKLREYVSKVFISTGDIISTIGTSGRDIVVKDDWQKWFSVSAFFLNLQTSSNISGLPCRCWHRGSLQSQSGLACQPRQEPHTLRLFFIVMSVDTGQVLCQHRT